MSDLKSIMHSALETAKKLGAQDAAATISRSQDLELSWRKAKIETISSACQSGLAVDLYVDGKYGTYSTSDLRQESVDAFIKKSIDMTRLLEADPARGLADPSRYAGRAAVDLQLYDEKIAALTPADAVDYCKKFEETVLAHKEIPIFDTSVSFSSSTGESYKATTNGFEGSRKTSYVGGSCEIFVVDGEKKPSDYAYTQSRHLDDLISQEAMAKEAVDFTAMLFDQKKLPSGSRTMILDRRVAASFISRYLSPISGGALIRKQSYFEGKIGQKLATDLFDLHDEPHIVRGLGSRLYDGEGMSTHPAAIFDKGTLKQFYLSNYAARKLGLEATTAAPIGLVLTPGQRDLKAMIKDVKDGIYITGFLGGNMDPVRGDFSYGIIGVAIENGELTTHVSEMNITGNFTEIMQRLVEVGSDPRLDSSARIPSLRFDDVAFSGT